TNLSGISGSITYTFTAYNLAGNCYNTGQVTVSVAEPISVAPAITDASCNLSNGSIAITPADITGGIGPFTYLWDNGSTNGTRNSLPTGSYSVTITDQTTNCAWPFEFNVGPGLSLIATAKSIEANCSGAVEAEALIQWINGTGGYTITWSGAGSGSASAAPGDTAKWIGPLVSGTYNVTVTDLGNSNCTSLFSFEVIDAAPIDISLVSQTNASACTAADGAATVTASGGGVPPDGGEQYNYQWSHDPNLHNPTATGLSAGNYTAYVYDYLGCVDSVVITIAQPAPTFSVLPIPPQCNGNQLTLSDYNGPNPGTFTWFDDTPSIGNVVNTVNVSGTDIYWVLYEESGCSDSLQVTITLNIPGSFSINPDTTVCQGSVLYLPDLIESGSGTFTFYGADPQFGGAPLSDDWNASVSTLIWVEYNENGCVALVQVA
ncbi:MAG TPA: SprB repeat-containing protein, partial [Chitinophagales bacterium]|nr:SprB repeat-containing protein [Chitinophagales bacterium]